VLLIFLPVPPVASGIGCKSAAVVPGFMIRLVLRRRSLPSQLSGLPLVVACLGAMLVASPPGASTLEPGPPATDVADGRQVKGLRKATAPQGRPLTR
jgi:hypothetical protein